MIVITTPTGAIGQQVLQSLLQSGQPMRVIAREPSRLPPQVREQVEVVQGSHGDGDVVNRAVAGAEAVFWLVPADPRAESAEAAYVDFSRPACAAFQSQGVKRVVGVSALGRGVLEDAGLASASLKMDDLIASTGVSYRALTMPSFMDNILWQVDPIKNQGMFFSPIDGDLRPRPAPTATSPLPPPSSCSIRPGAAKTMSRCSAPRTCRSTTWRPSCRTCLVNLCASSRFLWRPFVQAYLELVTPSRWRRPC